MTTTAVYIRVSTSQQRSGQESQRDAIQQYLDGHHLQAIWFEDELSGRTTKRPGFEKLQKAIFNGEIKTVVIWKLDRLSRSLRDGINILTDWIEQDIRIVAIAQQLDFSGVTGKIIASVLFAVAEMERENIRENTMRGLERARKRGKRLGRPKKITPLQAANLIKEGFSITKVAETLGVSRPAIYAALKAGGYELDELKKDQ
jgi:DNA invertase Pin-like site-specific DNA recombinase